MIECQYNQTVIFPFYFHGGANWWRVTRGSASCARTATWRKSRWRIILEWSSLNITAMNAAFATYRLMFWLPLQTFIKPRPTIFSEELIKDNVRWQKKVRTAAKEKPKRQSGFYYSQIKSCVVPFCSKPQKHPLRHCNNGKKHCFFFMNVFAFSLVWYSLGFCTSPLILQIYDSESAVKVINQPG